MIDMYQVYNIRSYDNNYMEKDGFVASIFIRYDKEYSTYSRKVYDLLTMLSDIGGLRNSLFLIGFFIASFVSHKIYLSKIIS
jgi:hypothetical protein